MFNSNSFNTYGEDVSKGLRLIDCLSSFPGNEFEPLALIKAVNYLHSLGSDKSIQTLQLYCDLVEQMEEQSVTTVDTLKLLKEPHKVFMVARILFVCKDEKMVLPELQIGLPNPIPKNSSLFPLFPIHVYQDIPFSLVNLYMIFGFPQPPNKYLDWCIKFGNLRATSLQPNHNPLDSVDEFIKSTPWQNLSQHLYSEKEFYTMLRLQALRAVSSAYPISKLNNEELLPLYGRDNEIDEIWRRHRQEFEKLKIFWNPVTNEYERGTK